MVSTNAREETMVAAAAEDSQARKAIEEIWKATGTHHNLPLLSKIFAKVSTSAGNNVAASANAHAAAETTIHNYPANGKSEDGSTQVRVDPIKTEHNHRLSRSALLPLWLLALSTAAIAVMIGLGFVKGSQGAPNAEAIAAELKSDPAFVASVTGPVGSQGAAGVSSNINSIVTALKEDTSFTSAVRGEQGEIGSQGSQGIQGPQGPALTDGEIERMLSTYVETYPKVFRHSVFASLAECQSIWIPHVGSTAGYYFTCPDGSEFTLPTGGSLTLDEAHERLAGRYP